MKTLFAALVATVAFAGVASAQEAPQLIGNYSANVLQDYNGASYANGNRAVAQSDATGMEFTSRAAIRSPRTVEGGYGVTVSDFDVYSGR